MTPIWKARSPLLPGTTSPDFLDELVETVYVSAARGERGSDEQREWYVWTPPWSPSSRPPSGICVNGWNSANGIIHGLFRLGTCCKFSLILTKKSLKVDEEIEAKRG